MQELLKIKLQDYLLQNRPDLLISLQHEGKTGIYLDDKIDSLGGLPERLLDEGRPPYIINELCIPDCGPCRIPLSISRGAARYGFPANGGQPPDQRIADL